MGAVQPGGRSRGGVVAQGIAGFDGTRLRRIRKRADLTADQLGLKIGVRENTVLLWETGRTLPTANNLSKLAQVLGVVPANLLRPRRGAETLRDLRERSGRSIKKAATESGVSASTIVRLERGIASLKVETADALAGLYEISIQDVEQAHEASKAAREREARI